MIKREQDNDISIFSERLKEYGSSGCGHDCQPSLTQPFWCTAVDLCKPIKSPDSHRANSDAALSVSVQLSICSNQPKASSLANSDAALSVSVQLSICSNQPKASTLANSDAALSVRVQLSTCAN